MWKLRSWLTSRFLRALIIGVLGILVVLVPIWGAKQYSEIILNGPKNYYNLTADCAVVLTGGPRRIREGVALFSRGQVKQLIISGVNQRSTMTDMMPEINFYPEIDLGKVILERTSNTTAGNAQQSLILVEALGCKSILLVTSDFHMNRALQTFEHIFPPTIQIIAYPVTSDRLRGFKLWTTSFEEFYKYLFYRVFVF